MADSLFYLKPVRGCTMLAILCFALLSLIFLYNALLLVIGLTPTLRKRYLEGSSKKLYVFPTPTPKTRSYEPSERYENHYLGV